MAADPFPSLASHRNEVRDGLFPSFPGEMSLAYAGACPEQSPACAPPLSDFSSPPSFASPLHVCDPYLPVHETAGAPHTFCCRLLPPVSPHAEGSRVSPFLRKQVRLLSPPSSSLLPPNLSPPLSASLAVATERDLDGVDAALLPPPHPASFLADAFAVSPPQDERERHAGAVPVCCNPGEVSGHIRKLRTASAPQTSENENNGCLRGRLEPRPLMGCASCGSYAGVASTNEGRRERGDARTRRLSLMSTEDTQTTSGSEALSDAHDHCTRLRDAPMLQKRERSAEAGDLCCRSSSWPRILYSPDELSATSSRATSSSDFHPRAPEPCGDGRVPPLASGGGASEPATLADLLTRTSEQERAGRHFGAGVLHYSAFSSTTPGACRDTREGADAFLSPPFSVFSLPESARERPGCGVNLVASPALPLSAEPAGAPGPAPQLCFCPLLEPQELAAGADPPQASTAHEGRRQDTAQSSFGSQATGELATGCRLTPSMPSPGQAMDPCQSAPRDLSQPTDALLAPFPPGASPERLPSQGPCHGVSRITQDSSPPPLPRAHSSGAVSSPVSLQTAPVPTGLSRTPSLPQSAAVGHVCFKAAEGAVTFSKSQCEKPCETQSGSAWSANYAADGEPCEPVSSFWITCGQHGPPARHAALQPSVTASARGPSQTPLSAVSDGGVSQGVEGPSHEGDSMRGNAPELILLAAGAEQLRKHATRESLTPSSSLMRDGVHAQSTSSSAAEGTAAALCVFRCLPPAQQPAAVPAFHVGVRLTGAVGACSADGMVVGNSAHLVSKVGLRGPQCGSGVPAFFHTVPNQHTYSLSMPHEPLAVNSSMSINPLASPLHAGSQLPEDQKRRVPLGAAFPSPHALTSATPGPPTAGENQGVRFLSEAAPLGTAGWVCFEAPVCRTLGATPSLAGRRATSLSAPPPPAALAAEGAQGEKSWVAAGSDSAHNKNPETVPSAGDQPDTANQQSPVRGSAESPPLASGAAQSVPPSQHVPLSHGLLHQGPQPRVMGVEAPCSSRMGSLPSGQKPLVASPSPSLRAVNGHECRHLDIHASSYLSPDAPALPCLLGATPSTPGDPTSPSMSQRRGCPALRWNATRACPRGSPLLSGPKEDPVAGAPAVMESSSVSHASGKGVSLSPPPSAPDVGAPRSQGHCAGSSTSTFGAAAPTGEDPSSATEALQRAQTDRAFSVLSSHASCSRRLYTPAGRAQGADQPSAVQEFEGLREKDGGELPPEGRAANGGLRTEGEDCGNRSPAGMAREGAALVALRCDGAHVIHATETPHTSTQTGNANEDPSWTGRGSTEGGSMSSTSNAGTPRDCGVLKEAAACEPRGTADARSIELESAFAPPGYRETGPDSADAVAGNPISASPGNSHVPIPAPEVLADAASRRGPSVNTSNGGRGGSFGLPFQRNCTSAGGTELPDEGSRLPSAATSGPAKTLGCGRNASPSDPSHFEERGLPATSQSFEQSPGYGFAAPLSYPPCSPRPSCLAPHGSRRLGVSTQTGASGAAAQAAVSLWPSSSPPPQGGSPSDEATCGASAHREKAGADCVRQASRIGRVRHAALGTTMSPPVPNLHENVSDPARGEGTENGRIRPHSPQEISAESPSRKRRPSCRREHEREGPPTGKRRASKRELIPDEDVSSSTPQFAGERRGSLASSPTGATETLGGHLFPFEKSDTERANSTKSVGLGMQEESAGHAGAAQASCRQPPLQPLCIPPKEAAAGVRDASSDATPGGRFAFDGNKGHGAADVFRHSEKPRSDQQSNSFGESNGKAGHARRTSRSRPSTHSDAARGRVRRGAAQETVRHSEGAPEPMTGSPLSVSDPGAWKAAERDAALPLLVYLTVPAPAEAHPHAIRSAQDMHAVGCGDRGTTRAAGSRVAGAESTKQESAAASPPRAAAGSLGVRSVGRYGTPQSAALLEKTQPDNGEDETPSTVLPSGAEQEPKDEAAPSRFMASGGRQVLKQPMRVRPAAKGHRGLQIRPNLPAAVSSARERKLRFRDAARQAVAGRSPACQLRG
ncbi:hypothetical protein BESB_013810 [Besnoitia besnoiti]|uniref:Uncharacterized protein n=1 Tax=Besnoitia besnoiti TaxID=94643 RepID=A0A2A9M497_BESBE|nr:hypothetical protein BESB_013810 [Besnoitia besnoiti]PFH32769.1 hypothetical protein BESB_013810 [Besnoitia besnoiti]